MSAPRPVVTPADTERARELVEAWRAARRWPLAPIEGREVLELRGMIAAGFAEVRAEMLTPPEPPERPRTLADPPEWPVDPPATFGGAARRW